MNTTPSTNGHRRGLDELREEYRALRLEQKIQQARMDLQLQAPRQSALREAWASFTGNMWGDFVDPSDAYRDADLRAAFPIGNRYDRQDGRNRPYFWTDLDFDLMRGWARYITDRNMIAQGALDTLTDFTIKTGYQWEVQPKKQYAQDPVAKELARQVEAFLEEWEEFNGADDDDNGEVNGFQALERSAFRRSRIDGECFMRHFRGRDGFTTLRFVEPEQVRQPMSSPANWWGGIQTDPQDIWRKISYAVAYQAPEDWEDVPAAEVTHLKLNVPENVKRGVSDFFSTQDALEGVGKLLRNMREAGSVQAAIAWIEQFDTATKQNVRDQVETSRDQFRAGYVNPVTGKEVNYQKYDPGSIPKVSKGREYVPPPVPVGASTHIQIVQANLRAVGSRWRMPEYMISGDSSNANYASTLVSGSPFVSRIECEQDVYGHYFRAWRWTAIRWAAQCGRFRVGGHTYDYRELKRLLKLHATPPQVAIVDKMQKAQIDQTYLLAGVKSRQTVRSELGLENDHEVQNIAEEPLTPPPAPEHVTARVDQAGAPGAADGTTGDRPPSPLEGGRPGSQPAAPQNGTIATGNPYSVQKRGDKFVVVKKTTGEVVGTHDTKEQALAHFRALEANVQESLVTQARRPQIDYEAAARAFLAARAQR